MEVEIETVPETQDPILKPGGLNKTNDIADVAQKEEREKRERVVAKTAETKKRVEEKKTFAIGNQVRGSKRAAID